MLPLMKKTTTLLSMALATIIATASACTKEAAQEQMPAVQEPKNQDPNGKGSAKPAASNQAPTPDTSNPSPSTVTPPKPMRLGDVYDHDDTVIALDGKQHQLRDLMQGTTVINFYSTESASQRTANTELLGIQKDFASKGVTFLSIDSNLTEIGARKPDPNSKRRPYPRLDENVKGLPLAIRLFADHRNRIADRLGAKSTPHLYVFDQNRRLAYQGGTKAFRSNGGKFETLHYVRDVLTKLDTKEAFEPFATRAVGDAITRAPGTMNMMPHVLFRDDDEGAKAAASAQDKLLMINFSGFNSSSGRLLESVVFDHPTARDIMRKHFVEARLHTDTKELMSDERFARNLALQKERTASRATPTIVVVDPKTDKAIGTFTPSEKFATWRGQWVAFMREMLKEAGRPL